LQQQYDTPDALRSFLRLCLDPGHGIKRTPVRLVEVLPEPLAAKAAEFAPHLGALRHAAQALDEQAAKARQVYADALAAWIHGEEPGPAPRRSMPLLDAVSVAYNAAVSHAAKCGTCWPGMRLAEMCPAGQREAIAFLGPVDREPECAHVAWEVTIEYRNDQGMWVKSRECADCGDRLEPVVEPEPHRLGKVAQPSAGERSADMATSGGQGK
jgi:hypothetical protein